MTAAKASPGGGPLKGFGARMKARREELGLTQKQVGGLLTKADGSPQSAVKVSQWEREENVPAETRRPEIADALQSTVDEIFGPADGSEVNRLDLVERRLDALIRLQGLGEAVEGMVRASRQADRRWAKEEAEARRSELAARRKRRERRGKGRGTGS